MVYAISGEYKVVNLLEHTQQCTLLMLRILNYAYVNSMLFIVRYDDTNPEGDSFRITFFQKDNSLYN